MVVGDTRDYHLYHPEHADRLRRTHLGDEIDLGDRSILFVPAIWRDMPSTLWAFDTTGRVLFASDAFAYLTCTRLVSATS